MWRRSSCGHDLEACLAGLQIYYREGGALDVVIAEEEWAATDGHAQSKEISQVYELRLIDATNKAAYRLFSGSTQ